jgi:hypothetical protein
MLQHAITEQRWSTSATSVCLRKAGSPMTSGNPAVRKDERARRRQRT